MTGLAIAGWAFAAGGWALACVLRRRLELVARAEHELRGPLTALAMAVELVRREDRRATFTEALETHLDRARVGLADLAAARRGRRARSRDSRIRLERVVRGAASGWAPIAAGAGRSLRLDWSVGAATVAGDRGRLTQAVANLLANAIEHGGGEVSLRGRRVGGAIRIEVADRGPAGAAEPSIGAPRAAAPDVPAALGKGLPAGPRGRGLRIAREAVEEHGGTLELTRTGGGTRATLELPLIEGAAER